MRVLLRKIHCPFICFCKPSSHIYTPGSLKLENNPHAHRELPHTLGISEDAVVAEANKETKGRKAQMRKSKEQLRVANEYEDANLQNFGLRSSFRNSSHSQSERALKKKVQWVDFLGKELAEIQEFESSEAGDTESEGMSSRGCVCGIL